MAAQLDQAARHSAVVEAALAAYRLGDDQLDAQLKLLEARRKEAERKADTRRKVIAGALALGFVFAKLKTIF